MFSQFIILQETRKISIRKVLKYELLACADGGMLISSKSSLGRELHKIGPQNCAVNYFRKRLHLYILLGSEYVSGFFYKKSLNTILLEAKYLITF